MRGTENPEILVRYQLAPHKMITVKYLYEIVAWHGSKKVYHENMSFITEPTKQDAIDWIKFIDPQLAFDEDKIDLFFKMELTGKYL